MSTQAYTDEEYRALLAKCGFRDVEFHPSLVGGADEKDFFPIVTRRGDDRG
jgi:hypothetical protein